MRASLPLLLLLGCDVPYDVPREPPDAGKHYAVPEAWKVVREDMVKAKACFAERRPYCVVDRDVLDEAIQLDLDTHFHGRMPLNQRWINELTGRSRAHWNESMKTKHRSMVAKQLEQNWRRPKRDKQKSRVDIHLFVPPGLLSIEKNEWRITSPMVVPGQELDSVELAKQLDTYRGQYPNMPVVRLLIDIPVQGGLGFRRWDVRHQLASDRIVVVDPAEERGGWVTEPLGEASFVPYMTGLKSLQAKKLERCALGESMADPPDCTQHPPHNPVKPRRQAPRKQKKQRPGWSPQDP